MSSISVPNTFSANTTISSSEVNANFSTIYNDYNGSINASNLATDAVSTAKIADDAVTSDKIAEGAVTPAQLVAGTGSDWAWQDWTPTLTNLSGGTLNYAKYKQVGKTVHFRFKYTLAGAGVGANPRLTLPVAASADYATTGDVPENVTILNDATGFSYGGHIFFTTPSNTIQILNYDTTPKLVTTTATTPFTWAANDKILISATYEAA